MRNKFFVAFIFLILIVWVGFFRVEAQDSAIITVTPQSFSKIIVRIPPFEGEREEEASSLIRKLLNYHLICIALKEPPLKGFKEKSYYLKGKLTKNGKIFFEGELIDVFEEKPIKHYRIEASSLERLSYALADEVIKAISPYQGISQSKLAFVRRGEKGDNLFIMDFSKRNLKNIRSAELILFPKFSPSGKKIAYLIYDKKTYYLEIYHVLTGEVERFKLPGLSSAPLWASDERQLYLTLGKEGEINIYKFSLEDKSLNPITKGRGVHQAGSISPDGRFIAYVGDSSGNPQVYILDLLSKQTKRISFEGKYNTSPRFSPKGDKLLYLSSQGGQNQLIIYNLKTGEKKKYLLRGIALTDPAFSPTGDYLIFKAKRGAELGLYLLHLDSLLTYAYLSFENLYYPDWGKMN